MRLSRSTKANYYFIDQHNQNLAVEGGETLPFLFCKAQPARSEVETRLRSAMKRTASSREWQCKLSFFLLSLHCYLSILLVHEYIGISKGIQVWHMARSKQVSKVLSASYRVFMATWFALFSLFEFVKLF